MDAPWLASNTFAVLMDLCEENSVDVNTVIEMMRTLGRKVVPLQCHFIYRNARGVNKVGDRCTHKRQRNHMYCHRHAGQSRLDMRAKLPKASALENTLYPILMRGSECQ